MTINNYEANIYMEYDRKNKNYISVDGLDLEYCCIDMECQYDILEEVENYEKWAYISAGDCWSC